MSPPDQRRGRALGLPFPGTPGEFNAITDVAGVEVGTVTLIAGDGPLVRGQGPVRTGVTAILPRGRASARACAAGYHSLNGNGEMTGAAWVEESGELQTPITITNTHSCGVTRDATLRWLVERGVDMGQHWGLPVAAETYDGELNDISGFHVTAEHTIAALDNARDGSVELAGERYTMGVFLQSNFGAREQFTLLGVPVGRHITRDKLRYASLDPLFTATVEAVEEAVVDSMLVNETMVGRDGHRSIALPIEEVLELMQRYGRPGSAQVWLSSIPDS